MHSKPDIILYGRVPSKKNQRHVKWSRRKRHSVIVPSDNYLQWQEQATLQILSQSCRKHSDAVAGIEMSFWLPDNIKTDLTNKAESVMDLLVDTEILKDDSWQYVPCVILTAEGIDREHPRVHIWIKERG